MAANKGISLLGLDTWIGLGLRAVSCLLLMGLSLVVALLANAWLVHEPVKMVNVAFLCMLFPIIAGLVVSEVPRGNDWLMIRMGLATFCRTGLPLLIVMYFSENSAVILSEASIGFLAYFYICGLLMSVWMSVIRVNDVSLMGEAEHAVV